MVQAQECIDFEGNPGTSNWGKIFINGMSIEPDIINNNATDVFCFEDGQNKIPSFVFNNIDFGGNWIDLGEDDCLCFDYKADWNTGIESTAGTFPKFWIYTGTAITSSNAPAYTAFKGRIRAYFEGDTLNPLLQDDVWGKYCLPVRLCSNGQLPFNNFGKWRIFDPDSITPSNVSGELTSPAACDLWDDLIVDVTGIFLNADYNKDPSEKIYFDNFCWKCTEPEAPDLCCDISDFSASLTENNGVFSLDLIGGSVQLQEVEVSVVDYHAEYNEPDCQPVNMGDINSNIGNLITTTSHLSSLVLNSSENNSHVLTWLPGSPAIINDQIDFTITAPEVLDITCCDVFFWFCIKVRVKDIDCNVCEEILCYPLNNSCACDMWSGQHIYLGENSAGPVPRRIAVPCNGTISYDGPQSLHISIGDFLCNPATCPADYLWTVNGPVTGNGSGKPFDFNFSAFGTYTVTISPQCGNERCEPCVFTLIIKKTDCYCNEWTNNNVDVNWTDKRGRQRGNVVCNSPNPIILSDVCSGQPITGNFGPYLCMPENCQVKYLWKVTGPNNFTFGPGTYTTSTSFSFIPTKEGAYILNVTPVCGNDRCKSCEIKLFIKNMEDCR